MEGRRHPIHLAPRELHHRGTILFVTACTKDRKPILATSAAHLALLDSWQRADRWLVGRYVIMPDHVHFFCAPTGDSTLEAWIKFWKSVFTRSQGLRGGDVWQRHHWDRQLRSNESYEEKWNYVRLNPVRHKLTTHPESWPYQGELNTLRL